MLNMVEMRFNLPALIRFVGDHLPRAHRLGAAADAGYLAKVALSTAFGTVPKPFRVLPLPKGSPVMTVLFYAAHPAEHWRDLLAITAPPSLLAALDPADIRSKTMPERYPAPPFQLDVLFAPTVQFSAAKDTLGRGKAFELPAFEADRRAWLAANPGAAAGDYPGAVQDSNLAFLLRKMPEGFTLDSYDELRSEVVPLPRPDHAGGIVRPTVPVVSARCLIRITDPAAFNAALARGVGRHRAYGLGMAMLRAA